MYAITLLRHGESEGNLSGIIQGQSEYPLTPIGEEQAQRLASLWKSDEVRFDLIISSPLRRASQTAIIIATTLKVPIEYEPAWKERNFGQLQGIKLDDVNQLTPPVDFFQLYEPIGVTGESQLDLYTRASQAIQNVLRRPEGSYLIVSHGGILNKALFVIMGITPQGHYNSPLFRFGNTGYAQFHYFPLSRQWALIGFISQFLLPQSQGVNSWQTD
jgi:2,3-bisphosphoglycerate-dependent phosphoglycerate mutase